MRPETIRCLLKFAVEIRLKEAVRPNLDAWGFNPKRLQTESGRLELRALATRYYRITHEAIRRYDPHHLIIGDRYEAGQPIADEVIAAALPFVDVLAAEVPAGWRRVWSRSAKALATASAEGWSAPSVGCCFGKSYTPRARRRIVPFRTRNHRHGHEWRQVSLNPRFAVTFELTSRKK